MPSTNSRNLTLTTVGSDVTITVTYNAVFSPFERFLAANGLIFQERIRVIGVDTGVIPPDIILHNFPVQNLPVTGGDSSLTIARNRSITVPRASLQEDTAAGDADEIRCRIDIIPVGIPVNISDLTDQESLLG